MYVNDMNIHDPTLDEELARLRRIAWRMDALYFIPRTNYSVGLDNIIGLIPVVGDAATVLPSIYMIWRAHKLGATPGTLAYMSGNLLVDLLIGAIPVVGDVFDVVYNANIRNYRALEANLTKVAGRARPVTDRPAPRLAA